MDVWLIFIVIGLCTREDDLKAQTSRRHRGYGDGHRMDELAVILRVIVGVFSTNPTFKIRYVAL
jgi:hypothetical protein